MAEAGAAGGGQRAGAACQQLEEGSTSSFSSPSPSLDPRAAPLRGVRGVVRAGGQRSVRGQGLLARVDGG